jgi:hypothetical protein
MNRHADAADQLFANMLRVPVWAVPRGPVESDADAAYMAGSALTVLDNLVRGAPVWGGAWRQRLALGAAASAARLLGRKEEEAALRDGWCFRQSGDDLGPAGSVLAAWRRLASHLSSVDADGLATVMALLGLRAGEDAEALVATLAEAARLTAPAPLAAAQVADEIVAHRPDAEILAWWAADLVLAQRLRWPIPVPILSTQIHASALRLGLERRRARPGGPAFGRALCLAAAAGAAEACTLAVGIAALAQRLQEVAPKLRAKGAGEVVHLLLDEDAVPASIRGKDVSRWAGRRILERLVVLGAARELTGRPSFRLYGL